jgi:hypothetical protein
MIISSSVGTITVVAETIFEKQRRAKRAIKDLTIPCLTKRAMLTSSGKAAATLS